MELLLFARTKPKFKNKQIRSDYAGRQHKCGQAHTKPTCILASQLSPSSYIFFSFFPWLVLFIL